MFTHGHGLELSACKTFENGASANIPEPLRMAWLVMGGGRTCWQVGFADGEVLHHVEIGPSAGEGQKGLGH